MKKKSSFIYESLEDPNYLKDKRDLLISHGNGWWVNYGLNRNNRSRLAK